MASELESVCRDLDLQFTTTDVQGLLLPEILWSEKAGIDSSSALSPDIFPITCCRNEDGSLSVVDGARRLMKARSVGLGKIPCGVANKDLGARDRVLLRCALNRDRQWNVYERVQLARWLEQQSDDNTKAQVMSWFGLSRKEYAILIHLASADETVVRAVADGALHLQNVSALTALQDSDQRAFLQTFEPYRLSLQLQREFLDWLPDIAFREDTGIPDVLSAEPLASVLGTSPLTESQRLERIRTHLRELRFPSLSRAEDRFREISAKANPDTKAVHFVPSPGFEKDELNLTVRITKGDRARDIFRKLSGIESSIWENLLRPYVE